MQYIASLARRQTSPGTVLSAITHCNDALVEDHETTPTQPFPAVQGQGRLGLELRGDKSLNELAEQFDVHPDQITRWRQQVTENMAATFCPRGR